MNSPVRAFLTIWQISTAEKMRCSAGTRIRIRKTAPTCYWWMLLFKVLAAVQRQHHSTGAIRVRLVLCAINWAAVAAGLLPRSARLKEVIYCVAASVILQSRTFFLVVALVLAREDFGPTTI